MLKKSFYQYLKGCGPNFSDFRVNSKIMINIQDMKWSISDPLSEKCIADAPHWKNKIESRKMKPEKTIKLMKFPILKFVKDIVTSRLSFLMLNIIFGPIDFRSCPINWPLQGVFGLYSKTALLGSFQFFAQV